MGLNLHGTSDLVAEHASFKKEGVYQPQLCTRAVIFVVRCDEPEDVVVPEHAGLVHLHLPHPRFLVQAGEDLDGHVATAPLSAPHLSKPASSDHLLQTDLPRYSSLQQQRQTGA